MDVHTGKAVLGRVVDALGVPIDGRWSLSDYEQRCVEVLFYVLSHLVVIFFAFSARVFSKLVFVSS